VEFAWNLRGIAWNFLKNRRADVEFAWNLRGVAWNFVELRGIF